ncbi:MAG: hypothetical protein A2516_03120 [Alphaproteobacteria bacterium RIFOXYD12_FULL_60_8]|nr:MAG: hypothetical protein A2516_03120 [Alphaproteobacteria bacterium RIFOXYD12_FULL_60_8]
MNRTVLFALFLLAAVIAYAHMPAWQWMAEGGALHPETYAIDPTAFAEKAEAMIAAYATGREDNGVPVVHPPEGDVYVVAHQFGFRPVLELEAGKSYRLHVSSVDILHGLNFPLADADTLIVPGQAQVLPLTPAQLGRFALQCSENCGLDHNRMKGWVEVVEPSEQVNP